MNKIDILYNEFNELKDKLMKNRSLNLKEDLKNKLIELDYVINEDYERKLDTNFPMTTTLEKEENRLEKLISFVEEKSLEQKKLINDYKKVTGETIELSYLKYSDNLKQYKERLNNVRKILAIIADIKNITKNPENQNEIKLKVLKNKLITKESLNLLYEFCLIDNLDIKEIDIDKLIKNNEINEEVLSKNLQIKENDKSIVLPEKKELKTETLKEFTEKKNEIKVVELPKEELKPEEKDSNEELEEKILTSMPIVEKIGSVVPVNVFESLQKAEEKLPDVVLPSNGLKDDQNAIFIDTKNMFEENEKK